jgi:hypothetical protein
LFNIPQVPFLIAGRSLTAGFFFNLVDLVDGAFAPRQAMKLQVTWWRTVPSQRDVQPVGIATRLKKFALLMANGPSAKQAGGVAKF